MKKLSVLVLILAAAVLLVACGSKAEELTIEAFYAKYTGGVAAGKASLQELFVFANDDEGLFVTDGKDNLYIYYDNHDTIDLDQYLGTLVTVDGEVINEGGVPYLTTGNDYGNTKSNRTNGVFVPGFTGTTVTDLIDSVNVSGPQLQYNEGNEQGFYVMRTNAHTYAGTGYLLSDTDPRLSSIIHQYILITIPETEDPVLLTILAQLDRAIAQNEKIDWQWGLIVSAKTTETTAVAGIVYYPVDASGNTSAYKKVSLAVSAREGGVKF